MPRFFKENFENDPVISGSDGLHIAKSLRMKPGEELTVCDLAGYDYLCSINSISGDTVFLSINQKIKNSTEPTVSATLFLCLLKGDGNDSVIRQAVEMGVSEICPVISSRCVSRPDSKSAKSKTERWQKIANEAAGQCGRGILPKVLPVTDFGEAIKMAESLDRRLLFYEGGGRSLKELDLKPCGKIGLFIGPEGGFDKSEVEKAEAAGFITATLGPRILRAVTAPLAALGAVMLLTGNMD